MKNPVKKVMLLYKNRDLNVEEAQKVVEMNRRGQWIKKKKKKKRNKKEALAEILTGSQRPDIMPDDFSISFRVPHQSSEFHRGKAQLMNWVKTTSGIWGENSGSDALS